MKDLPLGQLEMTAAVKTVRIELTTILRISAH